MLPESSCFESLEESSAFFEGGSIGYSVTRDGDRFDGLRLHTDGWQARPLAVEEVESSIFADETAFPAGSVVSDHALVMRDLRHRWQGEATNTRMVASRSAELSRFASRIPYSNWRTGRRMSLS
jgi:hypothetical protein